MLQKNAKLVTMASRRDIKNFRRQKFSLKNLHYMIESGKIFRNLW